MMKKKLHLFLLLFYICLLSKCTPPRKICECDLLENKEKYFIKSGKLISTNTNLENIKQGKEAIVELSVDTNVESMKKALSNIKGDFFIKVPVPDLPKYYHEFQIKIRGEEDRNMVLYFIAYCSFYPSYHEFDEGCKPNSKWKNKVEELVQKYLKPKNNTIIERYKQVLKKVKKIEKENLEKIEFIGKVFDIDNLDISLEDIEIYLNGRSLSKSKGRNIHLNFTINTDSSNCLTFEKEDYNSYKYIIPKDIKQFYNIPIPLKSSNYEKK